MSSRYQQQHMTTTSRSGSNYTINNHNAANVNNNVDNQLDELLEDLQMSVSSRGPNQSRHQMVNGIGGGSSGTTKNGYTEVIKSTRTQTMGRPVESVKEYRVEYLNPANSATVIQEQRSASPYYSSSNNNNNNNNIIDVSNRNQPSSYKTVTYQYNTTRSGNSEAIPSPKYDKPYVRSAQPDVKLKQNINELDSLLDDLNQTQNATFQPGSTSYQLRTMENSFPQPIEFSTPQKSQRVERIEQRTFEEQRYGTVNPSPIRTTEVKKEIIYNGDDPRPPSLLNGGGGITSLRYEDRSPSARGADARKDLAYMTTTPTGSTRYREASPARQIQEVYRYETKTSTRKGNEIPVSSSVRNYSYDRDTPPDGNAAIPFIPNERHYQTTANSYSYGGSPSSARSYNSCTINSRDGRRSPSPSRYFSPPPPTTNRTTDTLPSSLSSKTTNYSTVRTTQQTTTNSSRSDTGPTRSLTSTPYRSPSPASFPQPPDSPEPTLKSYNFERNLIKPTSPQSTQKFSPSDPSSGNRENQPAPPVSKTIITKHYNTYSSHQNQQQPSPDRYPPYNDGYPPNHVSPPQTVQQQVQHVHYTNRYSPLHHDQGRPFPSPTPSTPISEQRPPKQLDDLMATFSDTEISRTNRYNYSSPTNHLAIGTKSTPPPTPVQTVLMPMPIEKISEQKMTEVYQGKSNGIAGPPVYYPPGPLFVRKEESAALMESNGKGKMKASRKAKYKYESESRMRESSTTKKTVVPLCLPVCCALPCTIM